MNPISRRLALAVPVLALAVLGALLAAGPAGSARAICSALPSDGSFERQRTGYVSAPWIAEGRAGIDIRRGYSQSGSNNAWARNTTGWNAIRQSVRLAPGTLYTLKAFVRTSANVRDGYFGFRNWRQQPLAEIKFGPLTSYRELQVRFRPASTSYAIFAGFWAPNADSWIQIDNVRLEYPCNDVSLNPVDG
jgi:hypothetical protein